MHSTLPDDYSAQAKKPKEKPKEKPAANDIQILEQNNTLQNVQRKKLGQSQSPYSLRRIALA
jgi:hypothetical protein